MKATMSFIVISMCLVGWGWSATAPTTATNETPEAPKQAMATKAQDVNLDNGTVTISAHFPVPAVEVDKAGIKGFIGKGETAAAEAGETSGTPESEMFAVAVGLPKDWNMPSQVQHADQAVQNITQNMHDLMKSRGMDNVSEVPLPWVKNSADDAYLLFKVDAQNGPKFFLTRIIFKDGQMIVINHEIPASIVKARNIKPDDEHEWSFQKSISVEPSTKQQEGHNQ
jgi:hypothetical protein